jgi:hypothetical protein
MDEATLRERIRALLACRKLPTSSAVNLWGGPGTESPCSACGLVIAASEIEFEVSFELGMVERLHRRCYVVWDSERGRNGG